MERRSPPNRRRALLACVSAGLTLLASAALLTAVALAQAPPAVLPLIVVVCVGAPVLATLEMRGAIATLRAWREEYAPLDGRSLATLKRHLDRLPEVQHPLGL